MVSGAPAGGQYPRMPCILKLILDLPNTLADLILGPEEEIIYVTVTARR
jgi:hypothetical protein